MVEELGRADAARHEHRAFGHLLRPVPAHEIAQEPVGEVVEIVQPLAQIGIGDAFHARAHHGLHLLHRDLRGEAALDRLVEPAHPALVAREHPVGLEDVAMLGGGAEAVRGHHAVDILAHGRDGLGEAGALGLGVLGDGVEDDEARLVQVHHALGEPLAGGGALDHERALAPAGAALDPVRAEKGAGLGHLGDDHGDHFERLDLVVGVAARRAVLHDEDAHHLAEALDGHADEGAVDLLAGLRQVAEAGGGLGVVGREGGGGLGDAADEALADAQARAVHRVRIEALGGAELECALVALQVDGADLGDHVGGDEADHLVEPLLTVALACHHAPERAQEGSRSALLGHGVTPPSPAPPASAPGLPPWWRQAVASPNASCKACTASSMYFRSISTETLISEVVMTLMLTPSAARAANIFCATPAWLRMPMPTIETLATPSSTTRSV